jgi:hypothetical protein
MLSAFDNGHTDLLPYRLTHILDITRLEASSPKPSNIIDINNIYSNTTHLMILLKCIYYIVSFNDMFQL